MVDIDPMADYVPYGGSIRIRCLSFDQDALQYEWYVNNLLIKRGRSDMIPETLQPAGSQLYVRRLLKRAIFTCKVTNAAGAQNVTADIYVQPGTETIRTRKFSFNAFQFRPRCFHDNLLQLTMLTIPAISSGIRVFCGRKWQAAITGRNDVQQKQGVRNQIIYSALCFPIHQNLQQNVQGLSDDCPYLYRFSKLHPYRYWWVSLWDFLRTLLSVTRELLCVLPVFQYFGLAGIITVCNHRFFTPFHLTTIRCRMLTLMVQYAVFCV